MMNIYEFFNYETNRWEEVENDKGYEVEMQVEKEEEEKEYYNDNDWAF